MDGFLKPFDVLFTMGMSAFITYFIFIAALTISFLLIGLICWHGYMISRGVTSIERLLYQDYIEQCTKRGCVFVNPYDFGLVENWKRFFNVSTVGEFIRKVLLPSTHKPNGDGITWNHHLQSRRSDSLSSNSSIAFPSDAHLETMDSKKDH